MTQTAPYYSLSVVCDAKAFVLGLHHVHVVTNYVPIMETQVVYVCLLIRFAGGKRLFKNWNLNAQEI